MGERAGKQEEPSWGFWGPRSPSQAGWPRLISAPFTPRQQEQLFHFLQLMAGVEHYQQKFRSQASVIDEIVDTAFEVNQSGPEGRGDAGRPGPCSEVALSNSHMGIWESRG